MSSASPISQSSHNLINDRSKRYQRHRQNQANSSSNLEDGGSSSGSSNETIAHDNNPCDHITKNLIANNNNVDTTSQQTNVSNSNNDPSETTLTNDYEPETQTTTSSVEAQDDGDGSFVATLNPERKSSNRHALRIPKINLKAAKMLGMTESDLLSTTDRESTSLSQLMLTDRQNSITTARTSRSGSTRKREHRASVYVSNLEDLIKNSQNKIGEEVSPQDKEYELMKVINRGVNKLLDNVSEEIDPTTPSGDKIGRWKNVNFEDEYNTDITFTFRDMGAEFKLYCPTVFEHLRHIFRVSEIEFKKQLGCINTGNYSRLGTPGKSGAFFFVTPSMRYLLKSVTEEELNTMIELIPPYHRHVQKNPYTLMSNFFLLFEVTTKQSKREIFIVMNNVFWTPLTIHRKYDLKGSTAGRVASESERKKKSPILKDKDISDGEIKLNLDLKNSFYRRIENDVRFLQENDIMDYSLLLGVHNCAQRTHDENVLIARYKLPSPNDTTFSGFQRNYCASNDGKEIYCKFSV